MLSSSSRFYAATNCDTLSAPKSGPPDPRGKGVTICNLCTRKQSKGPRACPMLPKENSHAIVSRGPPRSLVGVSYHVPVYAHLSRGRDNRAFCVVNGGGTSKW